MSDFPPVVACNPAGSYAIAGSSSSPSVSLKRTAQVGEFLSDVWLTTKRALRDNNALLTAWTLILREEPTVPTDLLDAIAQKCGRLYRVRGLMPRHYFTSIRKRPLGLPEAAR